MGQTSNWIISNQAFKPAPNPCLSGSSQPQQQSPWQPPGGREEAGAALGLRQIATPCRAILLSRVNIALSSSCPVFFFFLFFFSDLSGFQFSQVQGTSTTTDPFGLVVQKRSFFLET